MQLDVPARWQVLGAFFNTCEHYAWCYFRVRPGNLWVDFDDFCDRRRNSSSLHT
jgi:hypothetical protein